MKILLHTIRRTGLVLVAATALAAVVVATAPAGTRPTGEFPPPEAIKAASANWAAKARLLDALGQPRAQAVSAQPSGNRLDWGDFGIGAGATLGLVLLAGGVAVARYSRGGRVRVRPAS